MFGRNWQASTGVVLESRVKSASVSEHAGSTVNREFVVAVAMPGGSTQNVVVQQGNYADFWAPKNGQNVKVEVEVKSGKVRFDKSDEGLSFAAHERRQKDGFDAKLG